MNLIEPLKAKWRSLVRREKGLVLLGTVIFLGIFVDFIFFTPVAKPIDGAQGSVSAKETELANYVKQRRQMTAELDALRVDPAEAQGSQSLLTAALASGRLWDSEAAVKWFEQSSEFFGPDLLLLTVNGAGEPGANLRSLYFHEATLHAKGDWGRVQKFLSDQEQIGAFQVNKMELISDPQGKLALKLSVRARSSEMNWVIASSSATQKKGRSP